VAGFRTPDLLPPLRQGVSAGNAISESAKAGALLRPLPARDDSRDRDPPPGGVVSPNRRKFRQAGFQAFTGEGSKFSEIPIRRYSDRMKSVSLVRNPFILGGNAGKERKT
jgi:hypothetical protein